MRKENVRGGTGLSAPPFRVHSFSELQEKEGDGDALCLACLRGADGFPSQPFDRGIQRDGGKEAGDPYPRRSGLQYEYHP